METDVIFRKEKSGDWKGEILALFPHETANPEGLVMCYAHIGQHGAADYNFCISRSIPATPEEYSALKSELESIGYQLNIKKKRNH